MAAKTGTDPGLHTDCESIGRLLTEPWVCRSLPGDLEDNVASASDKSRLLRRSCRRVGKGASADLRCGGIGIRVPQGECEIENRLYD